MKTKASSLAAQFGLLLLLALTVAGLLFAALRFGGGAILNAYFARSGFQERYDQSRVRELQAYIEKNGISARDTARLTQWVKRQPLILLEIYRANVLLYTSSAPGELLDNEAEAPHYSWVAYYEIAFADGDAEVVIYADDTYRFFTALTVASLCLSVLLFLLLYLHGTRDLIRYICILNDEIQKMEGGDLDVSITVKGEHELSSLARSLDSMRKALREQKAREEAAFQANQTMITRISHDLRTPMTVLHIYTDILKYGRCSSEQTLEYLSKIDGKLAQMKQLADNLLEYSLVSGEQDIVLEPPQLFRDAFHDLLSESVSFLAGQGFRFLFELDWQPVTIRASTSYLKRIMDNVSSNILKYAARNVPILIRTGLADGRVFLSVQNSVEKERETRETTKIGLTNVCAMMEKMGGECVTAEIDGTFRIELWLPCEGTKPE